MLNIRRLVILFMVVAVTTWPLPTAGAQEDPAVHTVEVSPLTVEAVVGQKLTFTATAKDASGRKLELKPTVWFAAPFDLAAADESGAVTFYGPGQVRVGAMFPGAKVGYATVKVLPAPVTEVKITPLATPLIVGDGVRLTATARTSNGDPRRDALLAWSSADPSIVTIDAAGLAIGEKTGRTMIQARSDDAADTINVEVVANDVRAMAIEPATAQARTGDVVRFSIRATNAAGAKLANPSVRWVVSGSGGMIESDGGFVAENPGTYVVAASIGDRSALASVLITPREVEREIEVVGRAPTEEFMAAEQWVFGNYVYLSTISDKLLVYDVSDPSNPRLTSTLKFDARLLNDVSTTPDGRIGVVSREGASSRKNGIVFLDTSNPAHPKIVSEYTETVTGGVHSAFIDGHYVYLTDDATGSLRVIDFREVTRPREVARWQVENVVANPVLPPIVEQTGSGSMSGRYVHDVQVKDGFAYLAYWRDGLVILDVGNGLKGGSPENPKLVSQHRFNHNELYGDGWIAGTHAVYRYGQYVFVGDEVFPAEFELTAPTRFPVRGIVHVIDVSNIEAPRRVAEYEVPEAGAHNIWVENDVLYMGYYNGGGRVVDVSGELRGDLYRQGREIARLWTGDIKGYRTNLPLAWGAQPHNGLIFFNDINTGLWIVKLGKPKQKGSTTAPGD